MGLRKWNRKQQKKEIKKGAYMNLNMVRCLHIHVVIKQSIQKQTSNI